MANPVYTVSQLTWDSDINPQGGAVKITQPIMDEFDGFLNGGIFLLNEDKTKTRINPYMTFIQPGVDMHLDPNLTFKVAGIYYNYQNLQGFPAASVSGSKSTNTKTAAGNLKYNYDSIGATGEIGYANIGFIPYAGIFGEYLHNLDGAVEDSESYLGGVLVGAKKVKESGDWQVSYDYRRVERDAVPDFLPDSDFYGGSTGVLGHHVSATYGLLKNFSFGLNWFSDWNIKPATYAKRVRENVLQADFLVGF